MKHYLVTGANSGIGLYATRLLAEQGHRVIAGARDPGRFAVFEGLANVMPVQLDVTDAASIDAAVAQLQADDIVLDGIVNNAGIAIQFPAIDLPTEEVQRVIDVNVLGVHRVTRAFVDDLIKTRGRIVNISSMSGFLSAAGLSTYALTKHALEAYSDALFKELQSFGIHVALIEPGNYDSHIRERLGDDVASLAARTSDTHYPAFFERLAKGNPLSGEFPEPLDVAKAILEALTGEPRVRYLVTPIQAESDQVLERAILDALQLNENSSFPLSKAELLDRVATMFDEDLTALNHKY